MNIDLSKDFMQMIAAKNEAIRAIVLNGGTLDLLVELNKFILVQQSKIYSLIACIFSSSSGEAVDQGVKVMRAEFEAFINFARKMQNEIKDMQNENQKH
jgi:hypothetical protein